MENIEDPLFVQEEIPIRNRLVRRFKIESVMGQSFEIKNGMQLPSGFKSYLLTYDRTGNRIRQQKYSREGRTICEWIYDRKGRPLQEIAYETSGEIKYRFEFVYDHDDNWMEKRMYLSSNKPHYRIVSHRDAHGRIITGNYYDSSGQWIRTDSYIYDDRGRLVRMSMGHMGEWIYEYDENNNLKKETGNLSSASVFGENFEFLYNDQGLLMRTKHLHYSVTVFEYTFFD
jgi:YD repeat-containing protein